MPIAGLHLAFAILGLRLVFPLRRHEQTVRTAVGKAGGRTRRRLGQDALIDVYKIPGALSLGVIVTILAASVFASLHKTTCSSKIGSDLQTKTAPGRSSTL